MPWPRTPVGSGRRCSGRGRGACKRSTSFLPASTSANAPPAFSAQGQGKPVPGTNRVAGYWLVRGAGVCARVGERLGVVQDKQRERRRKATERLLGSFCNHTQRRNDAERLPTGRASGSVPVE